MEITTKNVACICDDFNVYGTEHPYALVHDIHTLDNEYIEQGTDWIYFKTELEREEYAKIFNSKPRQLINGEYKIVLTDKI